MPIDLHRGDLRNAMDYFHRFNASFGVLGLQSAPLSGGITRK
jgi:hypothetical protein